jgi:hypothetical protein
MPIMAEPLKIFHSEIVLSCAPLQSRALLIITIQSIKTQILEINLNSSLSRFNICDVILRVTYLVIQKNLAQCYFSRLHVILKNFLKLRIIIQKKHWAIFFCIIEYVPLRMTL